MPYHQLRIFTLSTMKIQQPYSRAQMEDNIQKAIVALQLKESKSIRLAAEYFEVPKSTLADRMSGKKTVAIQWKVLTKAAVIPRKIKAATGLSTTNHK
ncbi:hypothetical protein VC83_03327 [Pseudogymnoascus destructans]|uniref:HTH psq-type domain-containing protein n=1 Tax=Pseudogymnoascus destructans TaxID=655981 RepID=A0A177AGG9_9PEZI|nr:uncharacterized protein VC83_03327 [Pseudogymnoascus destructans]OAF60502.1 hypothetical protein VC83_03327 [Pseudogymnoascus destructans]